MSRCLINPFAVQKPYLSIAGVQSWRRREYIGCTMKSGSVKMEHGSFSSLSFSRHGSFKHCSVQ